MTAITFGNPNLFVKGTVEITINDPATGNIVGYDNVLTDDATETSMNVGAVEGGLHNALILNIPDTTRLSGSVTSQAFSLEQRGHIFGASVSANGITPICETLTASSTSLTVSNVPAKAYGQNDSDTYGWCFVREHGATSWIGTNYNVNLTTKAIVDFTATSGKQYDVQYFIANASAKVLPIPTNFIPDVLSITLKYAVYAKSADGSIAEGTLYGYLFEVIPRAQFTGNGGKSGSQTTVSTTDYSWTALKPDESASMPNCTSCANAAGNYGYFIFCPCGSNVQDVEYWSIVGGNVHTLPATTAFPVTWKIPLVYILKDGSIVDAPYTDFADSAESNYANGAFTLANASAQGQVTLASTKGIKYSGGNLAFEDDKVVQLTVAS